ncbi:MAG: hypothetical protein DLM55_04195 [Acidimicrobiales bacterium]|nr:MAG: hypothetical protein DLM55_04195 [Acidimicrobiales bacterium]
MTDPSKQPASDSSSDAAAAQAGSGTEGASEVPPMKPEISPTEESSSASREQHVSPEAQVDQPASEAGITESTSTQASDSQQSIADADVDAATDSAVSADTPGSARAGTSADTLVDSDGQTVDAQEQLSSEPSAAVLQPTAQQQNLSAPPAPQATAPGYTEPTPGAHRPRGSRRRLVIVLGVLVVLLLVVGGVLGYVFIQDSTDSAHKAGKCIEQDGGRAKSVDCGNENAFKIIKRLNHTQSDKGCPVSETELYFVNETKNYVLCLKKNTAEN